MTRILAEIMNTRVCTSGKFFACNGRKWYMKGLTYGCIPSAEVGRPKKFLMARKVIRADTPGAESV